MKRIFQVVVLVLVVAFCFGQMALAESVHHFTARVVSVAELDNNPHSDATAKPPANLYALSDGFGFLPPQDSGGNDEWPCFPNTANSNYADCSSIAPGGVVIGTPLYTISEADCNATTTSAPPCGQVFWFYEDDTADNTDDLVVSITAKQGTNTVMTTGNFDFGPNPFPAGSVIVISDDTNFGTEGQAGAGNGDCAGTLVTCSALKADAAVTITMVTTVGKHKITQTTKVYPK